MDVLSKGKEPEGSLADIARAGRLLVEHERETAGALIASTRYGRCAHAFTAAIALAASFIFWINQ